MKQFGMIFYSILRALENSNSLLKFNNKELLFFVLEDLNFWFLRHLTKKND
jgi:hypothetical protein